MVKKKEEHPDPIESIIVVKNAEIFWQNFQGKEKQYNAAGARNFAVKIDAEPAAQYLGDGWNIKYLEPREEYEEDVRQAWLPVEIEFVHYPPAVLIVKGPGQFVPLDKDTIGMLDWADILKIDMTIRPYNWIVNGKWGTKAYLKRMYVTIDEDPLDVEYQVIPHTIVNDETPPWNPD